MYDEQTEDELVMEQTKKPRITMGEVFEDMKKEFLESLTDEQKRNLFIWCDAKIQNRNKKPTACSNSLKQ